MFFVTVLTFRRVRLLITLYSIASGKTSTELVVKFPMPVEQNVNEVAKVQNELFTFSSQHNEKIRTLLNN